MIAIAIQSYACMLHPEFFINHAEGLLSLEKSIGCVCICSINYRKYGSWHFSYSFMIMQKYILYSLVIISGKEVSFMIVQLYAPLQTDAREARQ